MPREENLLILKMLQEGTITAEQAAELLAAIDTSERAATAAPAAASAPATPAPPVPPVPPMTAEAPAPPVPPAPPAAALTPDEAELGDGGEAFARARAKIAAAREKVAGMQEKLTAAHDKLSEAEKAPDPAHASPWETVADALKDVPGARAVGDAFRGIDPKRIAAGARRQARRLGRQVRSSLGDLHFDLNLNLGARGEPILDLPREASATVPPGGMLRVRNLLGDIEAVGGDVPEARAVGRLRVWGDEQAEAQTLADQITLTVESGEDGPTIGVAHPAKVKNAVLDIKIFVPRGTKTSLLSPSGSVSARDLHGGVVLATQSGDVSAREIKGDVAAETSSGDITLDGIMGNVLAAATSGDVGAIRVSGQTIKLSTQSGDITLRDSATPVIEIETVSGDVLASGIGGRVFRGRAVSGDIEASDVGVSEEIHLDTVSGVLTLAPRAPLAAGSLTLATVSGDTDLRVPADADASLEISTKSGEVAATLRSSSSGGQSGGGGERTIKASGMSTFAETLGQGAGARITVSSVSGDISIAQATPPTP